MKVLQVSKFYPPVTGGIESVAFELTEGLNARGVATDVLCAHTERRTSRERSAHGYRIVRAGSWGKLLSTSMAPSMLLEARRLCGSYDVIHVHMPDPMAALALWVAQPRARLVVHWHSDVVSQRRALKLYEPLQEWLLRRADAVVATSPPYAESSPYLGQWKSKIHIIPNGMSEAADHGSADRAQAIRQRYAGRKIVFSLGRMTYYKGFGVLIDAARLLSDDTVVLVGGGGELLEDYRRRVVSEGLSEKIVFVGRIGDDDIAGYFAAADVFCLASIVRAEAYGMVLLEAMAVSKPVVATDIPGSGVPWVNQHGVTGLNAPPGDARALADALRTVLGDPVLAQRSGAAGRRRFLSCFTAGAMVESTLALYRNILANAA